MKRPRWSAEGREDDGAAEDASERESALLEKVRRYEGLLKELGALKRPTVGTRGEKESHLMSRDRTTPIGGALGCSPNSTAQSEGKLIARYGRSRYLENSLWTSVTEELPDPKSILEESSEEDNESDGSGESERASEWTRSKLNALTPDLPDLVLPATQGNGSVELRSLHPQPMQIFRLWQAYVDNVNPLVKILHVPTMQKALLEAAEDLDHVSKAMEALLFAIYVIAVSSMEEAECQSVMRESKASALKRFRVGTQQALRAAGILRTSSMMVLQAFVLFLVRPHQHLFRPPLTTWKSAAFLHHDPHSLWSLTGISIRIGQRIGLHRAGELLNLPPFETEMRRRLWMVMIQLDLRTAELCGCGLSVTTDLWATKPPLNVNDCDLYPEMREPPAEQENATEMAFLLLRAQMGLFLKQTIPGNVAFDGCWSGLTDPSVSIVERDRAIDEFEQTLEEKFVRHCDLHVPVQCMTFYAAKASICKLRLFAHFPRVTQSPPPSDSASTPLGSVEEENLLFTNSLRILECCTKMRTTKCLRRFFWHMEVHFQWHALIYLLIYLRSHAGPSARTDAAWATIDEVFSNHPDIIDSGRTHSKLCAAVGSLTLKAWAAHEAELRKANLFAQLSRPPPPCILKLRGLKSRVTSASPRVSPEEAQMKNRPGALAGDSTRDNTSDTDFPLESESDLASLDVNFIDWAHWDSMFQEFEMQGQLKDEFLSI